MTQEEQDYIEKHRVSLKDVPEGTVFWVFYEHFKVRSKVRGYVRLKGNRAKDHEGTVTPIFTTERYASGLVFVEDPSGCKPVGLGESFTIVIPKDSMGRIAHTNTIEITSEPVETEDGFEYTARFIEP